MSHGFDAVELDIIKHGDMLGPKLGERVFEALTAQRAASPVQAGIDPLVAEIEAALLLATKGTWRTGRLGTEPMDHVVDFGPPPTSPYMVMLKGSCTKPAMGYTGASPSGVAHSDDDSSAANAAYIVAVQPDNIAKLIAGYRSQADRIAEANERCAAAIDDYNTERNLRNAAESLLAEAREALEPFASLAEHISTEHPGWDHDGFGFSVVPSGLMLPFRWFRAARATLSRLKPGEKGGGE